MSASHTLTTTLLRTGLATLAAVAGARLAVLTFHRVQPQPDALFPGEMDAKRFEALMREVKRAFSVLPLREAAQCLAQGRLPARALAITFDDGYADNEEQALPILRRLGLPATFFVATGFLDGGRMWNDSVIEMLRRSSLPQIDLSAWQLPQMPLGCAQQRRAAVDQLIPKIKYLPLAEREQALARLFDLAGRPQLPDNLMMRSEQVRALFKAGMEVGGHTMRHPILTELPDEQARLEIEGGRDVLSSLLGAPVRVFAYPNGRPGRDYNARHVALVQAAGFEAAVTTAQGVSRKGDDLFQLPRFTPWDRSDLRWLWRLAATQTHTRFALAPKAA